MTPSLARAGQILPRGLVMLVVGAALLAGLHSGLARLGLAPQGHGASWLAIHGPLMISGFLGTLICLERAVALAARYRWSLVVPLVSAAGTAGLLLAGDALLPRSLLVLGSLGLVGLFGIMLRLHPSADVHIMAAGALCWLLGNWLWLRDFPIYQVVHLWTAFLILTIAGERLELSRIRRLTRQQQRLLVGAVGVYLAGVSLTVFNLDAGLRVLGLGALGLAAWLLRYDIARRTIRQTGLPRYIAACLLAGYVWLGIGGGLALWQGAVYAGPDYGALLHAFLLGFVFSMIFGHMPVILPALTSLQVRYTPLLYGHLILLHTSLLYRMYGNLAGDMTIRQQGGLLNVAAVLLFLGVTVLVVLTSNINRLFDMPARQGVPDA